MSHNFKPGDLAMVTAPANFGKVVTLVSAHQGPTRIDFPRARYQLVPAGITAWVVESDCLAGTMTKDNRVVSVARMAFGQRWLMPLRGDFAPEQQKAKEGEPCL